MKTTKQKKLEQEVSKMHLTDQVMYQILKDHPDTAYPDNPEGRECCLSVKIGTFIEQARSNPELADACYKRVAISILETEFISDLINESA